MPPGVWHPDEYAKLLDYDAPTASQPFELFMCHSAPDQCCSGWVGCHEARQGHELLALRLRRGPPAPSHSVPLFGSGREAAEHGLSAIDEPPVEARVAMGKVHRLQKARAGK